MPAFFRIPFRTGEVDEQIEDILVEKRKLSRRWTVEARLPRPLVSRGHGVDDENACIKIERFVAWPEAFPVHEEDFGPVPPHRREGDPVIARNALDDPRMPLADMVGRKQSRIGGAAPSARRPESLDTVEHRIVRIDEGDMSLDRALHHLLDCGRYNTSACQPSRNIVFNPYRESGYGVARGEVAGVFLPLSARCMLPF